MLEVSILQLSCKQVLLLGKAPKSTGADRLSGFGLLSLNPEFASSALAVLALSDVSYNVPYSSLLNGKLTRCCACIMTGYQASSLFQQISLPG